LLQTHPLLGVPITTKDSIRVKGLRNIAGIPGLVNSPLNEEDADVVKRLRDVGAIPLCSTNLSEAGLWWETSNTIYGRTNNVYDSRLSAGGSTGGEAALISSASSVIGIGSDVGGRLVFS
jgi:fatty acid amide hydrolase 2